MKILSAAVLSILAMAPAARAQEGAKIVKVDDFEGELAGWTAVKIEDGSGFGADTDSKVAITRDPQQVKSGKGALVYSYELSPTTIRVLSIQRPKDFTGTKSLRLWAKCTCATAILVSLNKTNGASYQATVYCPAGAWQEVVINVDEFVLDDPAKDPGGKLDLDEIESFHLMDLGSFLVRMLPDLKGPRLMWLDDVTFSSQAAPQTTGAAKGGKVHLVDTFESPAIRWMPIGFEIAEMPRVMLFDAPVAIDAEACPDGGKQSLKMTYTRQAAKLQGLLRNLEKVDLKKATALELSLKSSHDGKFMVSIQEKGGARYQKVVDLQAADGWKKLSLPFTGLELAQDSRDDNGKLDADQIKEISLADITTVLGGGAGAGVENVFHVDEVRFKLGD